MSLPGVAVPTVLLTVVLVVACSPPLPPDEDRTEPAQTITATSPRPTAEPPSLEWVVLGSADDVSASWSPDGGHLLVRRSQTNGPPEQQQIDLIAREGTFIRTYQSVDRAVWLDADEFVLFEWQRTAASADGSGPWTVEYGPEGHPRHRAYLASVGSGNYVEVEVPQGVTLSSGHGAVAVGRFIPGREASFSVWSPTEQGGTAYPGYPIAWSAAGDRLAVIHPDVDEDAGPGLIGWLDILEYPTMSSLYADREARLSDEGYATFDATGRYFAYPAFPHLWLADIGAGAVQSIGPEGASDHFAWDSEGRLVIAQFETGGVAVFAVDGRKVSDMHPDGQMVIGSGDGSVLVLYNDDDDQPLDLTILAGDHELNVQLPGRTYLREPLIAPDGSAIVATCLINGRPTVVALRL